MFLGYTLVIVSLVSGNIETRHIPLKDVCYQLADAINGQKEYNQRTQDASPRCPSLRLLRTPVRLDHRPLNCLVPITRALPLPRNFGSTCAWTLPRPSLAPLSPRASGAGFPHPSFRKGRVYI
jgi:hypothetical protein